MSENSGNRGKRSARAGLRIGPAGWSYADWSGYVYPTRRPKGFHEASFLARYFDTIEINTSFYHPIRPEHAAQWIERVAENAAFVFTAKLWQGFTHDDSRGNALRTSLGGSANREDERAVRAGFDVLRRAGKLGAVLAQFPFSFHRTPETVVHLTTVLQRFSDYPLVVELRHGSWETESTYELLREHGAGFCNIDQPVIGDSVRPTAIATGDVAYVRFHGRRYDTWFSDDPEVPGHERYNYLYSAKELDPWVARIREIEKHAKSVYAITNNHYQGKGVVNALELISALKGEKLKVPEDLRRRYPQLEAIASEMPAAPTLFPMGSEGKKRR